MTFEWKYPVYVIPLGAGFVSVDSSTRNDPPAPRLAVFTNESTADTFVDTHGISSQPRPLHNSREFGWLLQSLRHPVTEIAFDPLATEDGLDTAWNVSVTELLGHELLAKDLSPWNYPVFIVEQEDGFASIDGQGRDGNSLIAISLFTNPDRAEAYLRDAGEPGTVREIADREQARSFLSLFPSDSSAIALDPVVEAGRRRAKYCFPIKTLLDKYFADPDANP